MIVRVSGMLLLVSACGSSSAATEKPDALQCLVTFEKYASIVKAAGDEVMEKGLRVRQAWYAERARELPAARRSDARIDQLTKHAAATEDADLGIVKACLEQQDADPGYRAWKPHL